jgi:hypothetical protein
VGEPREASGSMGAQEGVTSAQVTNGSGQVAAARPGPAPPMLRKRQCEEVRGRAAKQP